MKQTKIIAEIGVNHNGRISTAKKLIDKAKICGADYVKFQIYKAEEMAVKKLTKAPYQSRSYLRKKENQFQMLKKYELSFKEHLKIYNYCKRKKVKYLASVFDQQSLKFYEKLNFDYYKIPSSELSNYPLLKNFSKLNKKIILSTGMSEKKEITGTLKLLLKIGFKKKNIVLLHCNSSYPTPLNEINLKKMISLKNFFKTAIGYSDHTKGFESAIVAATMGATIIEKHVTINKNMKGPDHSASLEFNELERMINFVRNLSKVLGNGKIEMSKSEKENILKAKKFLIAKEAIKKGQKFSETNLTSKRIGKKGIEANKFLTLIGKAAKKNFYKNEIIKI